MTTVTVRRADHEVFERLAAAFEDWPKPPELFRHYERRMAVGDVVVLAALLDEHIAGYCLVEWSSEYPPFAASGIPEISDLNVLPRYRGAGAGRLLLDAAEAIAASRSQVIGLLVGLYADYGPAQRMYARRGYVPDGRGVVIDGVPVAPGAPIVLDDRPLLALTREWHP